MTNLILPKSLINDRFYSQNPQEVAQCAMKVYNAVQSATPEVQTAAIGLAFAGICKSVGADPRKVFTLLDRMADDLQKQAEGRAAPEYAKGEIANIQAPTDLERHVSDGIEDGRARVEEIKGNEGEE